MVIVLFIIFCIIVVLVYQWFDNRYLYRLLVKHTKEWNEIRSSLNLDGMTAYERNQAVYNAYMKYVDKLFFRRNSGEIKYCVFPRIPICEPTICKLINGEWKEVEYDDLTETEKEMFQKSEYQEVFNK